MNNQIEQRINELAMEQKVLEDAHNFQVQENQRINQEFQKTVVKNQTRFAQITGAITELQKLVQQPTQKDNNHDNLPTTPDSHNRLADVRAGIESEDR